MAAWEVCQCLQKIVDCTTVDNEVMFSDLVLTQSCQVSPIVPFPGFANRFECTRTSSQPFGGRTGFERWERRAQSTSGPSEELASTREQELTAEIITIQSQKKDVETKLATVRSEKETFERRLDELQTQNSLDIEAPKVQAFINELQHDIGRLQYKVDEVEEKLREANDRADKAVTQRNKALIEKYKLHVKIDDLVEVARLKEQVSPAPLEYRAGIKRARSPTLSLSSRERSGIGGRGGGNNSFSMNDEGKFHGISPLRTLDQRACKV
ncbi:hypothetical protein sscle_07g061050 [Sclerotinia sclerotiorum 1980 UF-70]|nr:hypothetical protein sscle_07g061050 [Sclerotinia sclerotiorum 1980 UF-70]